LVGYILIGILFVSLPINMLGKTTDTYDILGGLSLNINAVKKTAPRALLVAIIGILASIGACTIMMYFAFKFKISESFLSGIALSSTSVAVAITIMVQHQMLSSPVGYLIITAALFDDIICLILLSTVTQIFGSGIDFWSVFRPIIASFGIIIVGIGLCFGIVLLNNWVYMKISQKDENDKKEKLYHYGLLLFMLIYGGILSFAADFAGSSRLLGAFMAGLAFSAIEDALLIWENKVLIIQKCLMTIFFASIGFIILAQELFQLEILLKGTLYSLVAAFGKLVTGFFHISTSKSEKLVVSFAMVARGELGLVLILQSFETGLMARDSFAITCWAIVICTLFGAIALQFMVNQQHKQKENESDIH
ncbi:2293_t:CDS:2, partial [Scutellospora calospora]